MAPNLGLFFARKPPPHVVIVGYIPAYEMPQIEKVWGPVGPFSGCFLNLLHQRARASHFPPPAYTREPQTYEKANPPPKTLHRGSSSPRPFDLPPPHPPTPPPRNAIPITPPKPSPSPPPPPPPTTASPVGLTLFLPVCCGFLPYVFDFVLFGGFGQRLSSPPNWASGV